MLVNEAFRDKRSESLKIIVTKTMWSFRARFQLPVYRRARVSMSSLIEGDAVRKSIPVVKRQAPSFAHRLLSLGETFS